MTSVTVEVPMTIRRRGGRKHIIGPDGAPISAGVDAGETSGDPALVKALARAFRWRRLLEEGRYGSIGEMATAESIDRSYVGKMLRLTLLAPDLVEAVLDRRQPANIGLPALLGSLTSVWDEQRACAAGAAATSS